MTPITVVHSLEALRAMLAAWRAEGQRIGLVPTMGALHEGHLSLVRLARQHSDKAVVSIFVNPTQFAPTEDFSQYPRTLEADCEKLGAVGDLVFAPAVEEMYPPGSATIVSVTGPATVGLEDRFRPTHFQGVATVVAKLLIQAMPDVAVFGDKDYQQLKVVARMTRDLFLPVRIVAGPTLREPDGLAMSSRNRYLPLQERSKAALIYRTLRICAEAIRSGGDLDGTLAAGRAALASAGFDLDYLEIRDAETLAPVTQAGAGALRLLVAARLGSTRLIDNVPV